MDQGTDTTPKGRREDEKKGDVREEGDDKHVHVEHACGEGEGGD